MSETINALDALLGASTDVEEEVFIKRLGTHFRVKGLSGEDIDDLKEQCTYYVGKGNQRKKQTNEEELGRLLIATSCVNPDFSDAKLLKHYGAVDAADCVQKALLAGEVAKLSHAILTASGFDDDEDEIEAVKN
ncbi:phage tail assembly chaperone [Bacillus sp. JJ722]|uniref:phage tail assembly chaperone n=1 Tax=Bacillus sp. JJ722 TaxID=3122973 RepID=UPI00300050A4